MEPKKKIEERPLAEKVASVRRMMKVLVGDCVVSLSQVDDVGRMDDIEPAWKFEAKSGEADGGAFMAFAASSNDPDAAVLDVARRIFREGTCRGLESSRAAWSKWARENVEGMVRRLELEVTGA